MELEECEMKRLPVFLGVFFGFLTVIYTGNFLRPENTATLVGGLALLTGFSALITYIVTWDHGGNRKNQD